jgi:phosphatidate cytidylyltransferase
LAQPERSGEPDESVTTSPVVPKRSLAQAVATAIVLVGLIAVCYALGRRAFFVLIVVVVLIALFEMLDALRRTGHRPDPLVGLGGGFALLLVAFLEKFAYVGVVLAATTTLAFVLALRPDRGRAPATDVGWTVLGVTWVGGGGAAATGIMMLDPNGLEMLVAFIAVVALDDIGAYFAGTTLGRHKMAPSISPAKSWEGFIGGIALALVSGVGIAALFDELTTLDGLAFGLMAGLVAPAGDLVESLFKREIGIKDSGRLLPGHGGLLDRLDAIILSAPVFYIYLRFLVY